MCCFFVFLCLYRCVLSPELSSVSRVALLLCSFSDLLAITNRQAGWPRVRIPVMRNAISICKQKNDTIMIKDKRFCYIGQSACTSHVTVVLYLLLSCNISLSMWNMLLYPTMKTIRSCIRMHEFLESSRLIFEC